MEKTARLWVTAAPDARGLVPAHARPSRGEAAPLPLHVSGCCQAAELAGPWLLRAAVRVPLPSGIRSSGLVRRRWLGALHVRWLSYMGVGAVALYEGPPVAHWASFAARLHGDVLVRNRKITSISEVRRPGEALLVGSTLLRLPPWHLLCRAMSCAQAEAKALEASSIAAEQCVASALDELAWGANLRAMLHLSLKLSELQEDAFEEH